MNSVSDIRYAVLQPLSGGMYLAAENAIGHPAEFIISYPGFDAPKYDKDGKLVDAGNEYNLIKYLEKHDRMVPYYQFDRSPFQSDLDTNVKLLRNGLESPHPDYSSMDLVVAVPVCSGLSAATRASEETLDSRNSNMIFLTKFTLSTIKPRVYIFENAPRLTNMSTLSKSVRARLESLASEFNYRVAYYKTDTQFHDNCQRRPRTFVIFFSDEVAHNGIPQLGFESNSISVEELLNRIPKNDNDPMNVQIKQSSNNVIIMKYIKSQYGDSWREKITTGTLLCDIINHNKLDDLIVFTESCDDVSEDEKKRFIRSINHIKRKLADGKSFYTMTPLYMKNHKLPACIFKTIPCTIHYKEDRLYTIREWLTSMGMPYDFEMYGDINRVFPKIGQNVPVRTAQFVISETLAAISNKDSQRINENGAILFDNISKTTKLLSCQ